jgi:hypothetical protein
VPDELTGLDVGSAEFGPAPPDELGPLPYTAAEDVATDGSPLGCSLASGDNPFPDGSLDGQIALISRGTCEFSDKVANADEAGAVAAFVYNSVAGGDNLQSMGAGARAGEVDIPSWFLRHSDGVAMVAFEDANPTASAQFTPRTRRSSPTSWRRAWTSCPPGSRTRPSPSRTPASGRTRARAWRHPTSRVRPPSSSSSIPPGRRGR